MSNIKTFFDVRDLPRAKNDFKLMRALFYLNKELEGQPSEKTAIESRSVEKLPKISVGFGVQIICGQCQEPVNDGDICQCQKGA